ncbi:hypothetical protein JZX87_12430 [Agrobacterium sp. Ap1]|jgi:hypothetical protein|uniref:hypothetical protein n=1 Tax=Agrobacterium sp. Ap1 TaxID=2815337 RepID=UPI000FABD838|nr:hypothetical protein [Agrobacterium sp. Ap1]MBO0141968.1 hypothetical protein [Agrobacterium sp. Ap1]
MDVLPYVVIFSPLVFFMIFALRGRGEIKRVGNENTAAVRENTLAVREHTEVLRQYIDLKRKEIQ